MAIFAAGAATAQLAQQAQGQPQAPRVRWYQAFTFDRWRVRARLLAPSPTNDSASADTIGAWRTFGMHMWTAWMVGSRSSSW